MFLLLFLYAVCCVGLNVVAVDYAPVGLNKIRPGNMTRAEAFAAVVEPNLNGFDSVLATLPSSASPRVVLFCEDCLFGPTLETREAIRPFLEPVPPPGGVGVDGGAVERLGDMARRHDVWLVAVVGEEDGEKQYNTAVAMDPRTGAVAARFRKQHLYYEPQFDAGPANQTLERRFEVEGKMLGLAICFDVLFADTWTDLEEADVVLAPSWWVSIAPLGSGIAMHSGVARFADKPIVFASSGFNWFNSGSAIIDRSGRVLSSTFNPTWNAETSTAVAELNIKKREKRTMVMTKRHMSEEMHTVTVFEAHAGKSFLVGDASCNASVVFSKSNVMVGERFGLIAFRGPYIPVGTTKLYDLDLCAIVRCSLSTDECASIYHAMANVTAVSMMDSVVLNDGAGVECQKGEVCLQWAADGRGNAMDFEAVTNTTLTAMALWRTH